MYNIQNKKTANMDFQLSNDKCTTTKTRKEPAQPKTASETRNMIGASG